MAAGFDLHSCMNSLIRAKSQGLISTQIAVGIPHGSYGRIAPRSGLALRNGIDVGAGVIDSDYRGELKVLLFNHSPNDFTGISQISLTI